MLRTVPFYYLRHGQTDWNLERRFQGQIDIPLNAYGLLQAENAAHLLRNEPIAAICSSPLQRALRTAEVVGERLGLPVTILDGLKEVGFGAWEGAVMDHSAYAQWRSGAVVPENAESVDRFYDRVRAAMAEALNRPGPVLVVAHGGVYWGVERCASFVTAGSIANAAPILHSPSGDGTWTRRTLVA